jgi:hypothetical protein
MVINFGFCIESRYFDQSFISMIILEFIMCMYRNDSEMPECLFGCGQLNRPNQATAPHWRNVKMPTPHLVAVPKGKAPHLHDPAVGSPPQEILHSTVRHEKESTSDVKFPTDVPEIVDFTADSACRSSTTDPSKLQSQDVNYHRSNRRSFDAIQANEISQTSLHVFREHERKIDLWEILYNSSSDEDDNWKASGNKKIS